MAVIRDYRDLDAWNAGMELVVLVYALVAKLPTTERFELSRQMRRAAVSIPSNVAEGQGNGPGKRYRSHVRIAQGSLAELETQLELCIRLSYVSEADVAPLKKPLARTGQLLHGLSPIAPNGS